MTVHNRLAFESGTILDEIERPGSLSELAARSQQAHIAPLQDFAERIAVRRKERVPCFDPSSAGIHAKALFLLQDPSKAATEGSRCISIHNNDQTAHNTSKAYQASGLDYGQALHWNIIPWWVKDPLKSGIVNPRRSLAAQAKRARTDLLDLLDMLKNLEVVILLGKEAQRAWVKADAEHHKVLSCPHPSPLAWNNVDPVSGSKNSALTIETFEEVESVIKPKREIRGPVERQVAESGHRETINLWLDAPQVEPLKGSESLIGADGTVADFWSFAMGDLRTNNVRGYFAEFLVAKAVGATKNRVEWDAFDVATPDGITIEVKTSAYLQAWAQRGPSTLSFSGLMAKTWTPQTGYAASASYNANVYVFCVQTATSHEAYNPMDLRQWDFFVIPRDVLAATGQKSLGIERVKALSGGVTNFGDLGNEIKLAAAEKCEETPFP